MAKKAFAKLPFKPKLKPMRSAEETSLRDEIAQAALLVALTEFYHTGGEGETWDDHDDLAEHCYSVADAMLKARRK
jgi:hypothetical protein